MNKYHADNKINEQRQQELYNERQQLLVRSAMLNKQVDLTPSLEFQTKFSSFVADNFLNHSKETDWQIQYLQELVTEHQKRIRSLENLVGEITARYAIQQAQVNELNSRFAIEMDTEEVTPTDGKGNDIG